MGIEGDSGYYRYLESPGLYFLERRCFGLRRLSSLSMMKSISWSRNIAAVRAIETISHLNRITSFHCSVFVYIIIILQLSKLYKKIAATRRSNVAASGFISGDS